MRAPNGNKLKLAIQRGGRLTEETLGLLRSSGLEFETYNQKLFSTCRNFDLQILYGRDDDIPEYVAEGTVDLGIVGSNLIHELQPEVTELLQLGFGYCSLVVAVPNESSYTRPEDLAGTKIATSYPRSAQRFFAERGIEVEVITLSGSVEVAPNLGLAAGIVELTSTGSTLLLNDLRPLETILRSEAVLVAHPASLQNPTFARGIDRLLLRFKAALAAKRFKYIMMNAPAAALPRIKQITPGMKSPTVVPLADPAWVAVHTVVQEETFWEVIEQLREAGASEILVLPIEKIVM